ARHDASRFLGHTRQDWHLAPRTWLKVDAAGVSDDAILRDYGDELSQRSSQRVESNVFLTRSWNTWNLVGDVFWYQDLTTRRPVVDGPTEIPSADPRLRRLREAGADLETKLTRVYDTGGVWNIDAMLHTIEPRVNYTWIAGKDKNQLPQWTPALDSIQDASRVEYSLTNRIRGRTVALANAGPGR